MIPNNAIGMLIIDGTWNLFCGESCEVDRIITQEYKRGTVKYYKDIVRMDKQMEWYRSELTSCVIHRMYGTSGTVA